MSEPSDEEMERAKRIRRLRSGGARSRGHEVRERRRASRDEAARGDRARPDDDGTAPDDDGIPSDEDESEHAEEREGEDEGEREGEGTGADTNESDGDAGPLAAGGEVDVLSMAAGLPEDGSLFVVPVREGLRRQFNTVAEQLHLRYGFQYGSKLDAERHVRPLALYLGVQALEDGDVEVVKELLERVDELDAPETEPESGSG